MSYVCIEHLNKAKMKTCKITFKSSKGMRFVKGQQYDILPAVGDPRLKLFKVYHDRGSFLTTENYINKFFN